MRTWNLRVLRPSFCLAFIVLQVLAAAAPAAFKTRAALHLENLALRRQLGVLHCSVKRPRLTAADRFFRAWLCEIWSGWRTALVIVKPETVIVRQHRDFRLFSTWKVRRGQRGHPGIPKDAREPIRKMSGENPRWGAPRIHGELLKLCIDIGETSVGKLSLPQILSSDTGDRHLLDPRAIAPMLVQSRRWIPSWSEQFWRHRTTGSAEGRRTSSPGLGMATVVGSQAARRW